jgi:ankyrin repeat protein
LALILTAVNAVRAIPSFSQVQPSSVAQAIAAIVSRDNRGFTPLHHAAASSDRDLLSKLLCVLKHVRGAGNLIDARDKHGASPLHWAVQRGNSAIIKDLLDAGASPNIEDAQGRSVLLYAISAAGSVAQEQRAYYYDMVRFLLQCGADVAACDQSGAGCVHAAVSLGDHELLGILVELGGAPVNGSDNDGENALFYAIREGHLDLVPKLLQYGIDPSAQNDSQENIFEYSRSLGNEDATKQLETIFSTASKADQGAGKDSDKMELASSNGSNLFASGGYTSMWSSNPAQLIH